MFIAVHRLHVGEQPINAFLYLHDVSWMWGPPQDIYVRPKRLVLRRDPVPPGGHRVASFLDLTAPDLVGLNELQQLFTLLHAEGTQHGPLPWDVTIGRCQARFNLEGALFGVWRAELHSLYLEAAQILQTAWNQWPELRFP